MKEYLNSAFELVVTNQPEDGFILVPDGAEYYADITGTGGYFYKFKQPFINLIIWHVPLKIWMQSGLSCNSLKNILWQRENKVETVKGRDGNAGRFLHQDWYEAFGRGEDVQHTPCLRDCPWTTVTMDKTIGIFNNPHNKFRLKPQTIQIGSRTIVKPISVKPEVGDIVYVANLTDIDLVTEQKWKNTVLHIHFFDLGLLHKSKEDALNHSKAFLETMK